jgi:2-phosphoglycolate phosphatase
LSGIFDGRHRAVFFDLDGTLVDTALDMVRVLQDMQRDHGRAPVAYDLGRSHVSNGAVGLLRLGFPGAEDDELEPLRIEYLDRYAAEVCQRSTLFSGVDGLLDRLDAGRIPWGVVTNKPARLTDALLAALGLAGRTASTVSGDTLTVRKPDPGPLVHACELAGVGPRHAIYVGDAARDIQAGRAAGMATVAAAYGYIVAGDDPLSWGADVIAADTGQLAQIVAKAVNLDA